MKKRLIVSLLFCAMTLGLIACGKSKDSEIKDKSDTEVTESTKEASEETSEEEASLEVNSMTDSEGTEIENYEVVCSMSDEEIESNITGVYKVLKTSEGEYMFAVYADTYEDFKAVSLDTYCETLGVSKELVVSKIEDGTFYDVFGYAYPDSYNSGSDEHEHDHEHEDILMTPDEFLIDSENNAE